jgi:toxin ParE1/3/4
MAPRNVRFLEEAREEAVAAFDWYSERNELAAVEFWKQLRVAVESISIAPERWPADERGIRKVILQRFPFVVFYREISEHVEVVAVTHARRRPGYWRDRAK